MPSKKTAPAVRPPLTVPPPATRAERFKVLTTDPCHRATVTGPTTLRYATDDAGWTETTVLAAARIMRVVAVVTAPRTGLVCVALYGSLAEAAHAAGA